MNLPADPFTHNPTIRLLCDVLDPDEHACTCGHGIQDHEAVWDWSGDNGYTGETVGACLDCNCGGFNHA